MLDFSLISGISVGMEYFDSELFGFGINIDLGILRITWFCDVAEDEEE